MAEGWSREIAGPDPVGRGCYYVQIIDTPYGSSAQSWLTIVARAASLREEHAVEWIGVVGREAGQPLRVGEGHRQIGEIVRGNQLRNGSSRRSRPSATA